MGGDCPPETDIKTMLEAAMRVPDHGKLNPWWFIVFKGDDRAAFGEIIKTAWAAREPQSTPEKLADEAKRLMRAPLVIAVISAPRESTVPVWEQQLSAGAACYNLCLAANALGYGANWLTEWYAFDPAIRASLKLQSTESVAGFIYIGTPEKAPEERPRPAPETLRNDDFRNATNRGNEYAKQGLGYVTHGPDNSVYKSK
ncbi:MAG: nitroreductase [Alphaproteobacteria bacterium]|nr:nitroreductase [Alphaproteobacteria bacterium]